MTTVAEISAWMEGFAPARLAESWDNVGLLWGDPAAPVGKVMTCLTVTTHTAAEAIEARAGLIVSHHPILFRPAQRVRADLAETGFLWDLARAGVAVYSPHTAFDNTVGGINDGLAARLGLRAIEPLRKAAARTGFNVVVFTPAGDREAILSAAFAAGAGRIGDYAECSFTTAGRGTFFGGEGSHPSVGRAGRREQVREWKVEFVCDQDRLAAVLQAVRDHHSYEEAAIDVFPRHCGPGGPGAGRVGRLESATTLGGFAELVRRALGVATVQVVGEGSREVRRVAIACGAGDDFVKDAPRAGADVLLTGEARYHTALEAEARGLGMVLAGHHATERPGVEDLASRLAAAFPTLEIWPSRRERDPIRPTWGATSAEA